MKITLEDLNMRIDATNAIYVAGKQLADIIKASFSANAELGGNKGCTFVIKKIEIEDSRKPHFED